MFIAHNMSYFNKGLSHQKNYVKKMEDIIDELTNMTTKSGYTVSEKEAEKLIIEEDELFDKFQDLYNSWRYNARNESSVEEIMYVGTIIDTYASLYTTFEEKMAPKVENI